MSGEEQQGSIDQDPQMQADIDRIAAEGEAAEAAAAAARSMPVPPGMESLQFPQDPHPMMRMMMDAMRASFQQVVSGMASAGAPAPAALSQFGGAIGDQIRTWETCGWMNVLSVAWESSRMKRMSGRNGVFNS